MEAKFKTGDRVSLKGNAYLKIGLKNGLKGTVCEDDSIVPWVVFDVEKQKTTKAYISQYDLIKIVEFSYAEQSSNSSIVNIILSNDVTIPIPESKLINYIEMCELNVTHCGTGLTCDPTSSEYDTKVDASDYLDSNFDDVAKDYFNNVLNK